MTGKELLLKKLQNYIETGEVSKDDVLRLFDTEEEQSYAESQSVIHLNGEVEEKQRFIFLPFYVLLFIIVGATFLLSQSWFLIAPLERVLATLGSGIVGFALGMFFIKSNSATSSLFHLVGAALIPFGALVLIDEFGAPLSVNVIFLPLFGFLAMLYIFTYRLIGHPVLFFLALFSAAGFFYSAVYFLMGSFFGGVSFLYPTLIVGAVSLLLGEIVRGGKNEVLSPLLSALGAAFILGPVLLFLSHSSIVDVLYGGLLVAVIALSLALKSRGILLAGALFLFLYLFYLLRHYLLGKESIGLILITASVVLIFTFAFSYVLHRKFIGLESV